MAKVVYRKAGRKTFHSLLILSALLLFGITLVNLFWPKRTLIELENRKAAQFPAFSVQGLLDGSWQSSFSTWMQDQFLLRDQWINTQRATDEGLVGPETAPAYVGLYQGLSSYAHVSGSGLLI